MLQRGVRKFFILFGQVLMILTAFVLALSFRSNEALSTVYAQLALPLVAPLIIIKLSCFSLLRLFTGWWRYVSLHDLVALVKANLLGTLLFTLYAHSGSVNIDLPWQLLVLDGLFCLLLMSGLRVAVRLGWERLASAGKQSNFDTQKILVVGAGAHGQSIVREIRQNPKLNWHAVGFVDQDPKRFKQWFQGVEVRSNLVGLGDLLRKESIDQVILANPALTVKEMREVVALCQRFKVRSKLLPNVGNILNGEVSIQHIRDVKLEDLLGRPPVRLDVDDIRKFLNNRRVLVTGAAGSIGREICRQVAEFGASSLVLYDHAETPLFQIERDLREQFPSVEFIPSLSDVRDTSRVDYIFAQYRPDVVFHAAAYKHVPMSECNPVAAVENNVLGTRNLVNAANRFGVDRFVMVSTDKAVNPTNIMGASKRTAEIYAQAIARKSRTHIVTVRFGNVLGSNGSVVPIFQEQIRRGGPVTVTDPEATRFFMTIPEAVQLVLQAGSMGEGGEIFILDMGEQTRIVQLAEELIRLSGLTPHKDIDIVFTGLRPGEKLHEELLLDEEGVMPTRHEKICVARATLQDPLALDQKLDRLAEFCRAMDAAGVLMTVRELVPEYCSSQRMQARTAVSYMNVQRKAAVVVLPFETAETA